MPKLDTERLLVIIASASVITAIAALCVAVQITRLNISGGGSININGSVSVQNDLRHGRSVPLEVSVRN